MMRRKRLLTLLLLLPFLGFAQKKTHFGLTFKKDFPKNYHVIGGYFDANKEVSRDLFLGAGFALAKFDHIEKLYFPVYGSLSYLPGIRNKKFFPVFFFQPGYGFYHRRENNVSTRGGLVFHGSAGIGYPFLWKTRGFAAFGIGHYGFSGAQSSKTSYGGRIGMWF